MTPYASMTDFDDDLDMPKWVACAVCGWWKRRGQPCAHCVGVSMRHKRHGPKPDLTSKAKCGML